MMNLAYLYLLAPLHTGGTTQEGNLLGIARESHTDLPYLPSSTIRGRLRAATDAAFCTQLWGNTIEDTKTEGGEANLIQGNLWIGDGALLWFPVPSLSHGVVWISSPLLLKRWARLSGVSLPAGDLVGKFSGGNGSPLYLKDAVFKKEHLKVWPEAEWEKLIPTTSGQLIDKVLVLSDQDCQTLIQMSLWRQVRVKLKQETKSVDGGFRYEEAIPPETMMYFPWGLVSAHKDGSESTEKFKQLIMNNPDLQIGGQESLGRGFVQVWLKEVK